jgi:hypothetical protein
MKSINKSLSFFKDWPGFIKQNASGIVFIPLFYSFRICSLFIRHYDLTLRRFPGRMIGTATIRGVDIAKRISLFYDSITLIIAVNIIFYLAAFLLIGKKKVTLKDFTILNATSLVGCILIFLNVLKLNYAYTINLIIIIHVIVVIFFPIKRFLLPDSNKRLFNSALFSITLCLGISAFFLLKELISPLSFSSGIYFPVFFPFICSLIFLIVAIYIRNVDYQKAVLVLLKLFWVLVPAMLLLVFTVLKDEIYLMLNNKGILYFTPIKIYFILLFLTAAWIYLRSRKPAEKLHHLNLGRILSNYYFPLLILGITTCVYYHPIIYDSVDLFEEANRFLPVMEFLKFHTIPLVEKFNSHMLSEILPVYLYAIFNKLKGIEPLIYDFIYPVSTAMIVYFIMRDLTHNSYVALFTVVLYPFTKILISSYFSPALIAVYVLYKLIYRVPSVKNYLLLFCSIILFVIWRIDLGLACFFSMAGILIVYSLQGIRKFNHRYFLTALGYMVAFFILVYFIFLLFGINLASNLLNEYNYLSSTQSYGYPALGNPNERVFQVQYFIFPAICMLLGGYILFNFRKFVTHGNSKFATLCLLFCIGFYVANFPRGLVRHSFMEDSDICLSSFIFFIMSGSFYLFCRHLSQTGKFLLFFFSSFLLINGFKYGDWQLFTMYEPFREKVDIFSEIIPQPGIDREHDTLHAEIRTLEFQNFISQELKNDETFADFSNEPMLYYYTRRITPSYFFQSPLSMHNDYLQDRFIKNLSNYKTPLLLFSNFPYSDIGWGFNNPDDVPNGIRHYRIAEYFYQQYEPFVIVRNYCLWKNKKSNLKNELVHLYTYKKDPKRVVFPDDTFQRNPFDSISSSKEGNILITVEYLKPEIQDEDIMYCDSNSAKRKEIKLLFYDTAKSKIYYSLKHGVGDKMKFYLNHLDNVASVEIDEVKYIPDFYSQYPRHWKIDMLPYIWANYDKQILSAPVQNIISGNDTLISRNKVCYKLPDEIDKSTGNYIYISLEVDNNTPVTVQLIYGPGNGEFDFTIPPGNGFRTFAVRMSSQYNWYAMENKIISLYAPGNTDVHLKKISLLKGD